VIDEGSKLQAIDAASLVRPGIEELLSDSGKVEQERFRSNRSTPID
jgi:hypothetical protein